MSQHEKDKQRLCKAIISGHHEEFHRMILSGVPIFNLTGLGFSAVHVAADSGQVECLKILHARGADLNERAGSFQELTPLYIAAREGHLEVAEFLLKCGVDLEARCGEGKTALLMAAHYERVALIDLLLKKGADVGAIDNEGYNALHHVLSGSSLKKKFSFTHKQAEGLEFLNVLNLLETYGVDMKAQTTRGWGMLHFAAIRFSPVILNELVQKGADVSQVNQEGNTALHEALSLNHYGVAPSRVGNVKSLIELGVNLSVRNKKGETALEQAQREGLDDTLTVYLEEVTRVINDRNELMKTIPSLLPTLQAGSIPLHVEAEKGARRRSL